MSQLESTSTFGQATTSTPSSNVATPTASGGPDTTTSALITATDPTSGLSSTSTSGTTESFAPSSEATGPTTTSSLVGTTSTSQPTSSSSVASAGSPITISSSSIPASTTPSTASSSSSVLPLSTTQPPISSSSQQGTPTIITSSFTTYVNGSQVLTQTSIPSTIPAQLSSSSSDRAAIIGGSAAGGTAVLILLLSLAFCARRKRFKRLSFLDAITLKRKQLRSRATLLDGEDLADIDLAQPSRRYTDYETPWDARANRDGSDRALMAGRGAPGTPHWETSRWSETGSAFKENAWPTHESMRLMDPLANRDGPNIDLGRIVDDVMGPSATAAHYSGQSVSSMYRDSVAVSDGVVHSRTVSNASNAALLEAAGLGGGSSTAPVRPSPLAQSKTQPRSVEHQGEGAP